MNRILAVVLTCHFLAAFTVLGMPMYLPLLFTDLGLPADSPWVGAVFAWPALLTAISAPLWGKVADRFGKRFSLIRALAGLSLAFAGAGLSSSLPELIIALTLQGVMGGTLAAANAYLATTLPRQKLAISLNWTQYSARLALVVAPLLLAAGIQFFTLQQLYLALAVLPMLGALCAFTLPKDEIHHATNRDSGRHTNAHEPEQTPVLAVYSVQALFCFSMVVTFPYFLPYAETTSHSNAAIAWMYVLPHLVYLIAQPLLKKIFSGWMLSTQLGLLAIAVAGSLQWQLHDAGAITAARLLFGFGIWLGYQGIHQLASQTFPAAHAGSWFGSLDGVGKLAGVAAGVAAGLAVVHLHIAAPFLLSAVACCIAISLILYIHTTGQQPCKTPAHLNKPCNNIRRNTTA